MKQFLLVFSEKNGNSQFQVLKNGSCSSGKGLILTVEVAVSRRNRSVKADSRKFTLSTRLSLKFLSTIKRSLRLLVKWSVTQLWLRMTICIQIPFT